MEPQFARSNWVDNLERILISYLFSQMTSASLEGFQQALNFLASGKALSKIWWKPGGPFAGLSERWLFELPEIRTQLQSALAKGIRFTDPLASDYPKLLRLLDCPPFYLSYWGAAVWQTRPFLAVVGSREPSALSLQWCEQELPLLLRGSQLGYVSGGARGIDQCVHRLSLREKRPTVILVPSGLLQMYPQNLAGWGPLVVKQGGAFLSECLPSQGMRKEYFVRRNRIISGLAVGTLIVEARIRSGTLLTAQHTIEQGRPLFVLPSHPLDGQNRGALNLLMDGATPVCAAADLVVMLESELRSDVRACFSPITTPSEKALVKTQM